MFLDIEKLPRKTKAILEKFEMIVIGKLLSLEKIVDEGENMDEDIDNLDQIDVN